MKNTPPRLPLGCLLICLVPGLTLLAATTCPHVSWFGQVLCGTMGCFLLLSMMTGLLGLPYVERLVRMTRGIVGGVLGGRRQRKQHPNRDLVHMRKRIDPDRDPDRMDGV